MMGKEIFKIDAPWAQKLTKMRVPFLMAPTVHQIDVQYKSIRSFPWEPQKQALFFDTESLLQGLYYVALFPSVSLLQHFID